MTNATIANELRDEMVWEYKVRDLPVNRRVLDVAVHEVSNAWNGGGVYRVKGLGLNGTPDWGRQFDKATSLAWEAYHAACSADLWDVLDTAFSVTYLGESF